MKKLLFVFSIFSIGAVSFGTLRQATSHSRAAAAVQLSDLAAATTHVGQLQAAIDLLREETNEKQRFLNRQTSQTVIRRDLLELLENANSKQPPTACTDLRRELGIGWDSSDDYVLVSKRVLKRIGLHAFSYAPHLADTARAVLAISREEEAQIKAVVQQLKDQQLIQAQRLEPEGDILARYLIPADDTKLEQNISNRFCIGVTAALGAQRAGFFLDTGWPELRSALPIVGPDPVSFTVRRAAGDGEQKLIWQTQKGAQTRSGEVRYANHPANWFSLLFPRGWRDVAERNGFELPDDFEKRNNP